MKEKGTRLPDDWTPSAEDRTYAVARGFSESEIARIAEDFLCYWTTKVGTEALHRLWPRVWQRWCRVESDRRPRSDNVVSHRRFESSRERGGRDYLETLERLKTG